MSVPAWLRRAWHFLEHVHLAVWIGTGIYAVGVAAFIKHRTLLGSVPWHSWLCMLTSTTALFFLLLTLFARRSRPVRVERAMMIATGNRLILGAKTEVVMFGGDMSWAPDYRDSLHEITARGKRAMVVFPESPAERVRLNAKTLSDVGATMLPLRVDLGLRAMLIDPADQQDGLVYLVERRLRKGGAGVASGEPGTSSDYEYLAKVFDTRHDQLLVRTMHRLCGAVSLSAGKNG